MAEIRCPKCGTVFAVDESGYAELVRRVRDAEFAHEIHERQQLMEAERASAVELAAARARAEAADEIARRDEELAALRVQVQAAGPERDRAVRDAVTELERERDVQLAERDLRIAELEAASAAADEAAMARRDAAVVAATGAAERRVAELEAQVAAVQEAAQAAERASRDQLEASARTAAAERAQAEAVLKAQLVEQAADAKRRLSEQAAAAERSLAEQRAEADRRLRDRDDEIERLRNLRSQLSTKLVGESLEQHCEAEFNKLRATAFARAEFHKDNEVVGGSKGDYVFRETDEDGTELVSIMFEMKSEEVGSTRRHRNEDFFAKLDRDRHNKGCEYAVLVSLLEPDNDFYNSGIADVSWAFEKMYVIRPQLFVPMISILRNAAAGAASARRELAEVRRQDVDIAHFEEAVEDFKARFGKNYETASRKFEQAIGEIDRAIRQLEKVKASLTSSERQLRLANDKASALSIRRLTRSSPTMRERFAELAEGRAEGGDVEAAGEVAAAGGAPQVSAEGAADGTEAAPKPKK